MLSFLKRPSWETDGADWPLRETSHFVDAGDYRWHVQRGGAGPVLLLVHGTGASTHSWAGLAPLLAKSFDVVAFDLPGHGFTTAKSWSAPTLGHVASAAGKLLEKEGAQPVIAVGHSAGAAIIIRMLSEGICAFQAGISINGALSPFHGAAGLLFPVMAKFLYYNPLAAYAFSLSAQDIARVRRLVDQTGSDVAEDYVRRYATLMRRPGHISGALGMMAHWDLGTMNSALDALTAPFAFIAGGNDKAVPPADARRAAERAPSGRSILLPELGHLAHEEAPEAIADIVTEIASDANIL